MKLVQLPFYLILSLFIFKTNAQETKKPNPMIQFFRKIRQRLLTENKISKYILHAVSEIVLIS